MAYLLGDIYIGNFNIIQYFGDRHDLYHARYNLNGHNGIDIECPSMTLILSANDGFVSETGFDPAGYGNYVKVVHDGYLTLYGHLNDVVVKKGDHVVRGQLVGHSNNSGLSEGPHLHFGVAPCDASGVKTEANNGFSGYIDPLNTALCTWEVRNIKQPVVPGQAEVQEKVAVLSSDFVNMVAQGSNYKVVASYLVSLGINEWLTTQGLPIIDLVNNPKEPTAGENIVKYLKYIKAEVDEIQKQVEQTPTVTPQTVEQVINTLPQEKKDTFLKTLGQTILSWIWVPKQ